MGKPITVKLINGARTRKTNVIGYCHLERHSGYLTKNLIKVDECLEKKCNFLRKLRPEYWKDREDSEKARKIPAAVFLTEQLHKKNVLRSAVIYTILSCRHSSFMIQTETAEQRYTPII